MEKIWIILIAIGVLIMACLSMYWLLKQADVFFRKADEIEGWIRKGEPQDTVVKAILELTKTSFHRITGDRLTELAKMAEIKYNIKLLK